MHFLVACTKHHIHTTLTCSDFINNNGSGSWSVLKYPPEVFCKKSCSLKFRKINRKAPIPESFFKKVADLRPATLSKKSLWGRCFFVHFLNFKRLLLSVLWVVRRLLTEVKSNPRINELKKKSVQSKFWFDYYHYNFLLNISDADILFVISPISLCVLRKKKNNCAYISKSIM